MTKGFLFSELSLYKQLRSVIIRKQHGSLQPYSIPHTHTQKNTHSSEKQSSEKSYIEYMVSDTLSACLSVKAPQQVIRSVFQGDDPVLFMKLH